MLFYGTADASNDAHAGYTLYKRLSALKLDSPAANKPSEMNYYSFDLYNGRLYEATHLITDSLPSDEYDPLPEAASWVSSDINFASLLEWQCRNPHYDPGPLPEPKLGLDGEKSKNRQKRDARMDRTRNFERVPIAANGMNIANADSSMSSSRDQPYRKRQFSPPGLRTGSPQSFHPRHPADGPSPRPRPPHSSNNYNSRRPLPYPAYSTASSSTTGASTTMGTSTWASRVPTANPNTAHESGIGSTYPSSSHPSVNSSYRKNESSQGHSRRPRQQRPRRGDEERNR